MAKYKIGYRPMSVSIADHLFFKVQVDIAESGASISSIMNRALAKYYGLDPDIAASGCRKKRYSTATYTGVDIAVTANALRLKRAKDMEDFGRNLDRTVSDYRSYLRKGARWGNGAPVSAWERCELFEYLNSNGIGYEYDAKDKPSDEDYKAHAEETERRIQALANADKAE